MDGHLLRFNKKARIAFLDFESYNLNLTFINNRPWQSGMIEVVGDKIVAEHDIIVNWLEDAPELRIDPMVAAMNHYNEPRIRAEGITPKEGFEKTTEVLKRADWVVWHNGLKFDYYLYRAWAEENGADWKWLLPKTIDTKSLAQGVKMNIPFDPKRDNFLEYQYRMANIIAHGVKTKLSILAKEYGITFDETKLHDAIYDLTINKLVFDRLKMQVEI